MPLPSQTTHSPRGWHSRRGKVIAALLSLGGLLAAAYAWTLVPELSALRAAPPPEQPVATIAYTADGRELTRYYREHRLWRPYHSISPHAVQALIATEDHRFRRHTGIDLVRLFSAAFQTAQGDRQGASTLTMQLARNLYRHIRTAPPLERKIREMATALKIEHRYTKREILEMYLNTVPFGHNAFGIEAAAQVYFGKGADALDVLESATLVGVLKGTTRYDPVHHPERARQRRNVVLRQMSRHGHLSPAAYDQLREAPVDLSFRTLSLTDGPAPYFAAYVRSWLEGWAEQHGYDPYADGLRVYTTLDARLQEMARAAVTEQAEGLQAVADYEWSRAAGYELAEEITPYRHRKSTDSFEPFSYFWKERRALVDAFIRRTARYRRALQSGTGPEEALAGLRADAAFMDSLKSEKTRLEAGLVALDPRTGFVKAWVGGRDFRRDQYDKVALARRQPGSTFKPFVYAAAVDHGFSPEDLLPDSLVRLALPGSRRLWTPRNRSGYSGRLLSLREGLVHSNNIVAAQLITALGPGTVADYARRMGIQSPLRPVPSLALGTSEVTLLEMASAYATLAVDGHHRPAIVVTRIEDQQGRVLATFAPEPRRAISRFTAYTVLDMMRGVVDRGTGAPLRTGFDLDSLDLAGKTGTTQHNADGWFLAVHPELVTGAWVGFNDRRVAFRSDYWGQGAHNALRLVGDFLQGMQARADTRLPNHSFRPPPGYRAPEPSYAPRDTFYHHAELDGGAMRNAFREGLAPGSTRASQPPDGDADPEAALRRSLDGALPPRQKTSPEAKESDIERALRESVRSPAF